MKSFWNTWWFARLNFILASIEFGAERWLYQIPRYNKKREFVEARTRVREIKKHENRQALKRTGKRGK